MFRLYLLGLKGFKVISNISVDYNSLISDVIVGRDNAVLNDYFDDISNECSKKGLMCYERGKEPQINSDYIIAIGWRWIINAKRNLIVIHDSILPKLRGFNPLVTALINGNKHIGATALLASAEYDTGPIITNRISEILYPIKIKDAIDIISDMYVEIVSELIYLFINDRLSYSKQDDSKATYSLWRDEKDYLIDWASSSNEILRFIDAVGFPYKGAKALINGNPLRILDAEIVDDVVIENRCPGKVIFKDKTSITIVCGTGLIKIREFYNDDLSKFNLGDKFRLRFNL